jgi:hypothetical protein
MIACEHMQQKIKPAFVFGLAALLIVLLFFVLKSPRQTPSRLGAHPSPSSQKGIAAPPVARVVHSRGQPAEPTDSAAVAAAEPNAADFYRQAFALYDALSKEEKDILSDWKKEVDPAKAAELLKKIQPILDLLQQAAATGQCDWGLGKIGPYTLMPHLGQSRNLGRVAMWAAAQTFATHPDAATDVINSELALGKNAGDAGVIGLLVNSWMQSSAMAVVSTNAALLNASTAGKLVANFGNSDFEKSFQQAIAAEIEYSQNTTEQMVKAFESGQNPLTSEFLAAFPEVDTNASPAQIVAQIRESGELQAAYLQAIQSPDVDLLAWSNHIASAGVANSIIRSLMPGYNNVLERYRQVLVQRTMMAAGLSYRQEGVAALEKYTDPATGRPFICEPTTNGFRLRSTFVFREQPVEMSFPR